jgi:hypothetical protein
MSLAAARPAARPIAASSRIPWWVKILIACLAALIIGCILIGVTAIFGRVTGTEFSPQTFDRRTYSYWQLPLVRIQITQVTRVVSTGALENHLMSNAYIPATPNQITAWDLVKKSVGTGGESVNDPQILLDYLDLEDAGGYQVWLRWSEDHPDYAQVFWPVIARLVRGNLYLYLPEFFRIARAADGDAQSLADELQAAELKLHRELGARAEKEKDIALAFSHYKAALSLAPMDAELKKKVEEYEKVVKKK